MSAVTQVRPASRLTAIDRSSVAAGCQSTGPVIRPLPPPLLSVAPLAKLGCVASGAARPVTGSIAYRGHGPLAEESRQPATPCAGTAATGVSLTVTTCQWRPPSRLATGTEFPSGS